MVLRWCQVRCDCARHHQGILCCRYGGKQARPKRLK
jgi:hypothetical protein